MVPCENTRICHLGFFIKIPEHVGQVNSAGVRGRGSGAFLCQTRIAVEGIQPRCRRGSASETFVRLGRRGRRERERGKAALRRSTITQHRSSLSSYPDGQSAARLRLHEAEAPEKTAFQNLHYRGI